jgi:mRNA interferase MazF
MKRGEIWWAALPSPAGPGLRRPVVVVQSNPFNDSRISTVVIATITSNLALAAAPGNVRIGKSESGLTKPSVVNVSQVLTIDRSFLAARVRALPAQVMSRVDSGLRLVLGL